MGRTVLPEKVLGRLEKGLTCHVSAHTMLLNMDEPKDTAAVALANRRWGKASKAYRLEVGAMLARARARAKRRRAKLGLSTGAGKASQVVDTEGLRWLRCLNTGCEGRGRWDVASARIR